jgi:hypothetical protein
MFSHVIYQNKTSQQFLCEGLFSHRMRQLIGNVSSLLVSLKTIVWDMYAVDNLQSFCHVFEALNSYMNDNIACT